MTLVRWALVCLGLIYLLTQSGVLSPLRGAIMRPISRIPWAGTYLVTLVYCPACIGFWVGCAVQYFLYLWTLAWGLRGVVESGIAAMAVGAIWNLWARQDIAKQLMKEVFPPKAEGDNG